MVRFGAAVFACMVLAATVRAEPEPGPRVWPDRIADVSAAEFWKQVEEDGLLPKRKYESFFRALPADAGGDAKGRDAAIAVLDAALALGDLRDGPHVDLLDYEGSHVLGEPQIHSVQAFRNARFDAWFLRSKTFSGTWEQWGLVQDKRVEPNVAYSSHYRDGKPARVNEQSDCYRCHSSGPLHRVQAHSIQSMITRGLIPPRRPTLPRA